MTGVQTCALPICSPSSPRPTFATLAPSLSAAMLFSLSSTLSLLLATVALAPSSVSASEQPTSTYGTLSKRISASICVSTWSVGRLFVARHLTSVLALCLFHARQANVPVRVQATVLTKLVQLSLGPICVCTTAAGLTPDSVVAVNALLIPSVLTTLGGICESLGGAGWTAM